MFWQDNLEHNVILDSIQHLTMQFSMEGHPFIITFVYARCTILEKLELWDELEGITTSNYPWLIGVISM